MKCNVLDFIPEGEQNAISARELSQLLHCHRRKITLAINYLRCNGEVICSNTHGYYRPACVQDAVRTYRHMASRQREIARAAKKHNVPTVLISGALRGDCRELEKLFAGCFSVSTGVCTLDEALAASEENIVRITRNLAAFAGAFLSENKVKRNK